MQHRNQPTVDNINININPILPHMPIKYPISLLLVYYCLEYRKTVEKFYFACYPDESFGNDYKQAMQNIVLV